MSELPVDGERVVEGAYRHDRRMHAIYLMHIASYRFAQPYTTGKQVLDLGCGSGYGAALIAKDADNVIAVDVSEAAIRFAEAHHAAPNLAYRQIQPDAALPFDDASFDVVLSFQVLEHVSSESEYLAEAWRILRRDGVLILVTPNRAVRLLPMQKPWNRWHLKEYDSASLIKLFSPAKFVAETRYMVASKRITDLEVGRYRRLKWMTLPVTLPFLPEMIRKNALNLIHGIAPQQPSTVTSPSDFEEHEIEFCDCPQQALNLVVLARKK